MLLDAFRSPQNMILFLLCLPTILISLSFHEWAHAYSAYKLGDPTARNLGRLSLDPTKHLDLIGTLCMMICGFGWAKPVPVNSRNFKKPLKGMALTALAGPLMNLTLSFAGCLLYRILVTAQIRLDGGVVLEYVAIFFLLFAQMNAALAVFNLLPIPPLDGSRLLWLVLPPKWTYKLMRYERYIYIALLLVLFLGVRIGIISWVTEKILSLFYMMIGWLPFL